MLRRASQFAAVVLVIVVAALPVAACMVPEGQMTAAEHQCCQKMANNCETVGMPSSHSCCQHPASQQTGRASKIEAAGAAPMAAVQVELGLAPLQVVSRLSNRIESPPESPPPGVAVLRI